MSEIITLDVTRAGPQDLDRISLTLAQAFQDDPVLAWVVPDPRRRASRLRPLFAAEVEAYLPLHETHVACDAVGAALWAPPGTRAVPDDQMEARSEFMAELLGEDLDRAVQVLELLESHHPERGCFYLQWLGVVPDRQGLGVGSRLLSNVLRRCDRTATPAYLEATSVGNRRLYERHGFRTMVELHVPDGPPIWPMWREPATPPDRFRRGA